MVPVGIGLFTEGIASVPTNRKSEYGGSSRDTGVTEVLQKPRIVKKDQKPDKIDLDAEQKTLTDLLGEDDDELNLDEDTKTSSSDDFLPFKIRDRKYFDRFISLSMAIYSQIFVANKSSIEFNSKKLETDVKIKIEPVDDVVMGESLSVFGNIFNR